jgi:AmmeMemoRadiSam system protein A
VTGQKAGIDFAFTDEERDLLKKLVRTSIEHEFFSGEHEHFDIPETLKVKVGAFVTLKIKGELKGCIGYIRGMMPLDQTVQQMAIEAAFHDPRFMPLNKEEWKDTEIEISVLTPLKKVVSPEEIKVGIHGIYLENGSNSGLLLPQVATEHGWDRQTFLEYTCLKAGLKPDAWKLDDTTVYVFSADVF